MTAWLSGMFSFIHKPIERFFNLRERIKERISFYANVYYQEPVDSKVRREMLERAKEAQSELRALSVELSAFVASRPRVVWLLKCRKYDPKTAAENLMGLSNALKQDDPHRRYYTDKIEKALRLPPSYSEQQVERALAEE